MTIYETLGVRRVLNVAGPVTRLSGAPLHPAVAAAACIAGLDVAAVVNELIAGDPPVAVTQNFLHERGIGIVTALLKPGEEMIVAERLRAVLG